jgi:DNA invertase Pin-like site-specific DNA recombinase
MGRLVLNILLSFAQFEREIISERTRDKIAATRRKGKWTGGVPLLGYDLDPQAAKLQVNPKEAARVRASCSPLSGNWHAVAGAPSAGKVRPRPTSLSQAHAGWLCLPDRYDDGGFTGGNMDRPALARLLSEIRAGKVDCVVVYKVDRLSRSLLDFALLLASVGWFLVSSWRIWQAEGREKGRILPRATERNDQPDQ